MTGALGPSPRATPVPLRQGRRVLNDPKRVAVFFLTANPADEMEQRVACGREVRITSKEHQHAFRAGGIATSAAAEGFVRRCN